MLPLDPEPSPHAARPTSSQGTAEIPPLQSPRTPVTYNLLTFCLIRRCFACFEPLGCSMLFMEVDHVLARGAEDSSRVSCVRLVAGSASGLPKESGQAQSGRRVRM